MFVAIQVEVNETVVRSLSVINVGRFMCDYNWQLKYQSQPTPAVVSICPESGSVAQGDKADCDLSFVSSQPITLKHCELILKVHSHFKCIVVPCCKQHIPPISNSSGLIEPLGTST